MNGNPVGSSEFSHSGGPDWIRLDCSSSLPNRGDVVDVDSEFWHLSYPKVLRIQVLRHAIAQIGSRVETLRKRAYNPRFDFQIAGDFELQFSPIIHSELKTCLPQRRF